MALVADTYILLISSDLIFTLTARTGPQRVDPAGNGHEPSIEFGRGCAVTDAQFNVRQNLCVPITIVVVTNRGDDLITVVMIYVPESHPQYN